MSFPTLLVHLDDDARAEVRLAQALQLAQRFSSCLVGVSSRRPVSWAADSPQALLAPDVVSLAIASAQRAAHRREAAFLRACDHAEIASFEVVGDDDEPARALVRRSRCADLVVLGQPDPYDPEHAQRREIVDQVVLKSARPSLLLPYAGRIETLGDNILVAWDESREAARAIADALPLLRRARTVHLVQFDPSAGGSGVIDQSRNQPVLDWLRRHGITAKAAVAWSTADVGNALLSHAADVGADLLVMGAWGQSRLTERVLGGATRTVMGSMTLPVFTSH
jgi:nucleotide-binding universal stress UspA family protein